ncbi:hypothetical protein PT974_11138 [Cladobotryum mycophilum]|uniref:Uncharacterized protein n=1 Tax=Cladobotryum mycophilum TaxID=491253 RepID=A0ABR0S4D0_9HYPO
MSRRACFTNKRSGSLIGRTGYELKYNPRLNRITEQEEHGDNELDFDEVMGVEMPAELGLMSFLSPIVVPVLIVMGVLYLQALLGECSVWILHYYQETR